METAVALEDSLVQVNEILFFQCLPF